jgi:demethylmenaquinone methyltransferase / 2-methoxy-6-polyprenyl-1,4-benzoquinol methylase
MSVETGRLPAADVRSMFDGVAPVYDAMNRLTTAGLDGRWRKLAARAAVRPGDRVLDACCGTGELALAAKAEGGTVTGLDFAERMLARARRKSAGIKWVRGDVLALPFTAASFDAVTIGFGLRNVEDRRRALQELRRVLRRGGRLAILEVVRPRGLLSYFYAVWFDRLIPLAGRILPGGAAYTYLPASVKRFPDVNGLEAEVRDAGFEPVAHRLLGGGIVVLLVGEAA